jgi:hypothetical protein
VHAEPAPGIGGHRAAGQHAGEYSERAETYLRLLAEAVLRPAGGHADRVYRAADTLVAAGALAGEVAGPIIADLQQAMRVRRRPYSRQPGVRPAAATAWMRRRGGFQPGQSPPWRVLPAGPATPGSRLMALILTIDRALAPATLFFPAAIGPRVPDITPLTQLSATDDLGTAYGLGFSGGSWAGSAWTGTVMLHPVPPAAARWLAISSQNGQLLRADLTAAPAGDAAAGLVPEKLTESPGERLLTRQAEAMLAALAIGVRSEHNRATVADTVATLEAAGALSPLSPAPARLAALGQLLGLPMAGPADEVPARWTDVVAYYGRRRRPAPVTGTAAIGAALPELDGGARFAIAGLHSGGSGTFLHLMVQGLPGMSLRRPGGPPVDTGFSLWLRDDAGGWHLATVEDLSPVGGPEALLRLALLPPLGHATRTLTVQLTGSAQQVTATLAVRW